MSQEEFKTPAAFVQGHPHVTVTPSEQDRLLQQIARELKAIRKDLKRIRDYVDRPL